MPPYAWQVVGYKEETKVFPIGSSKSLSNQEIKIIKEVLEQYMDVGFLSWPVILNFDSFINLFELDISKIKDDKRWKRKSSSNFQLF